MSRLIDAEALLEAYADRLEILAQEYGVHSGACGTLAGAMKLLEMQPTIEPERKHGHWIDASDESPYYYICSECGTGNDWKDHFCRECGSKMEGAEQE